MTVDLLDSAGNVAGTTTTAGDGAYLFTGVTAGTYTVQETDPSGYVSTTANSVPVSVPPGGAATANFGDQQGGAVSGTVYEDTNNNGTGDIGIGGVSLDLVADNGRVVATVTTSDGTKDVDGDNNVDAIGYFYFSNVPTGVYSVVETQPDGYVDVTEFDGGDDGDHSDNGIVNNIPVTVDVGETDTGNNFVEAIETLPVTLSYIHSERTGDTVIFRWQTATETASAGFNILVETVNGLMPLNSELIPSQVIDSVETTTYELKLKMKADVYYFQEVSIYGDVSQKGPFQVGAAYGSSNGSIIRLLDEGENRLFLPILFKR